MEAKKVKVKRLRALGKLGGLAGGPARALILTSEERVYIARLGAAARWAKHTPKTAQQALQAPIGEKTA